MNALTICQPYAELIMRREKRVENRTWRTDYRGAILIHAGKSREWLMGSDDFDFGCIVGTVDLVGSIPLELLRKRIPGSKFFHLINHEHTEGPYCWIMENPVRLAKPIPCKGALGLWNFNNI